MSKLVVNEERIKKIKLKLADGWREVPTFSECKKYKRIWFKNEHADYGISYYKPNETELEILARVHEIAKENTLGRKILWSKLERIFQVIEDEYSNFNREDASVKSAPDTSKFIANKAGWLKFDKKFSVTEGYCQFQRYFHYAIKVGGNFNYGRPFTLITYILKAIETYYGYPTYSDGKKPIFRTKDGTNWSAIGIG